MAVATLSPPADARRQMMIDSQLRPSDVIEPRLIAAIASVDREAFVPAERRAQAYADRPVPLSESRALNTPLATARLIDDLRVRAGDRVLLIGAATGYTAAVLAAMGAQVTAVEEDAGLAALASTNLSHLASVEPVTGPLAQGAAAHGPFDKMLIDGAVEAIPITLSGQLAEGGRIACGLAADGVTRLARGVQVTSDTEVALMPFADMDMPGLPGFAQPRGFQF
jgi:protein-L-isoaspartate(D-aspartate) O-methyltransferase